MNFSQEKISKFQEWMSLNVGLYFSKERNTDLLQNLSNASKDFGYLKTDDFIDWIITASLSKDEIQKFSTHFTVSETYFWREPRVFDALEKKVIPELIYKKRNSDKKIKIWCAGCSSGEEPYSIAILLKRSLPDIESWDIQIIATDINPNNLSKAKKGVYTQWSFRNVPEWFKTGYFDELQNGKFEIKKEVKKYIHFEYLNLKDIVYPQIINNAKDFDIIFCRNVLMYFQPSTIIEISSRFYDSLVENGWFLVSSSELSNVLFSKFSPVNFPGAIFYRKCNSPKREVKLENFKTYKTNTDLNFKNILNYSNISTSKLINGKIIGNKQIVSCKQNSDKQNTSEIQELDFSQENILGEIKSLANSGEIDKAENLAKNAIEINKSSPKLYYLYALILMEKARLEDAVINLNKSVYLDNNFIMGYFSLGNIFLQQGNIAKAKRFFNTTLELTQDIPNDSLIMESDGIYNYHLKEILIKLLNQI